MSFLQLRRRKILSTATLTANGLKLASKAVSFSHRPTGTSAWHLDGTAQTNLSGIATFTITGLVHGTHYDIEASFAGTASYEAVSATKAGILV